MGKGGVAVSDLGKLLGGEALGQIGTSVAVVGADDD